MASNQNEQNQEEQQFNILPHPAKSNFPGSETEATTGLGGAPTLGELHQNAPSAFGGRGDKPHIISQDIAQGLEAPKSREELRKLQEEINK
ncbi:hypothetical protein JCM10207_000832 [Rhodosporidiobolus poonsookiae]